MVLNCVAFWKAPLRNRNIKVMLFKTGIDTPQTDEFRLLFDMFLSLQLLIFSGYAREKQLSESIKLMNLCQP